MSLWTMAAILVNEPYCMNMAEIGKLTPQQLSRIYWHPRDKSGEIVSPPADSAFKTEEDTFKSIWAARGLSDRRIAAKWRAHLAQRGK